jgi:peptidoglycan hydrolase FlgJ
MSVLLKKQTDRNVCPTKGKNIMNISLDPSILTSEQAIAKLENISKAGKNQQSKEELKKVANDFEAIFVNLLIKAMWKTIPDSGLYSENPAMGAYTDIMQSALSEEITKVGGIGIAQALYEDMQKNFVLEQNKGKE